MAVNNVPPNNQKNSSSEKHEDDKYDFTNLTFEELFRVPIVEMSFRGEPLGGPDFFELDFLALQQIPFLLPEDIKDKLINIGSEDDVNDDSFDFLALSFEDLMKVPVRLNRWQDNDTVPEPDLESLSLEDLMKLPVRRAFIADLDPNALNKLLGGETLSDLPSTESGGNNNSGSGNYFQVGFGNTDFVTDNSPNYDNGNNNNNNNNNNGGGFTPPPPNTIPIANNDGAKLSGINDVFYAIKSFGFSPFSQNTGNLLSNDQPGTGGAIQVNNTQGTGLIPGVITVNPDGAFTYAPPDADPDNNTPGSPINYSFTYNVKDQLGAVSNYATVSIQLYDPPALSINDVQIIEGIGSKFAIFTITLTGAIPIPLTISYTTQDGLTPDHIAVAGQDYTATSGSYTFSNINPLVTTQTFTVSVTVLNDVIPELVQKFYVNLDISGTFVNSSASDLIGEGAISDPDKLKVLDVTQNTYNSLLTVFESGLSPDGSNPDISVISQSGNILTGQNFGQIPLSGIDINNLTHPDQSGPAVYDNILKTWTLTGSYFELIVYREDILLHNKGDFTYTLKDNVNNVSDADFIQNLHFDVTPIDPGSLVNQATRTDTGDIIVHIVDDLVNAQDDTGFYAIKGGDDTYSSGNLFTNDTPGADRSLRVVSFDYNDIDGDPQTAQVATGGSTSVTPYYGGILTVYSNGEFEYIPPEPDNDVLPGAPYPIDFNYIAQDTDGSYDNANVNIKLYDQPKLSINNVEIIEGEDLVAIFTVTLTGAIPSNLTIGYYTQDGTALAGEDYTAILNGSHTFSDLDPTHITQTFEISVDILDDNITELVQDFKLILDISGTYINTTTSTLIGEGAISDPDILQVNPVTEASYGDLFTVFESGLSPDGSNAGLDPVTATGNLFTNQDFGEIPTPDSVDISQITHPDETAPAVYDADLKTWTLTGDYFELVVYREDIGLHSKGDFVYTLTDNYDHTDDLDFLQSLKFYITPIDPDSLVDQTTRTGNANLEITIVDDLVDAQDDTGFYAIKGGDETYSSGNLLDNDTNGADTNFKIVSITYFDENNDSQTVSVPDNDSVEVNPYYGGTLMVYSDGNFEYLPPDPDDDVLPGAPNSILFSYVAQDTDGSEDSADVNIKLYDQPIIVVEETTVTEGTDSYASVIVKLIGQIPANVTVNYTTDDSLDSATDPDDYTGVNGSITFSNFTLLNQQQTIQVPIIDDEESESTEEFIFKITSGNVNLNSNYAQNQAEIEILDNDEEESYTLKATNDTENVSELCLDPDDPVNTAAQTGNLLINDTTGTVPSNLITVKSIEFIVDNLLINDTALHQDYLNQGASISVDGIHYTVSFNLLADNTVLPITMPDGSVLKVQADGHYEFYQPQGGITQDTQYDWTYTITAPNASPVNPGDDKGVLSITLENEVVYANNDQLFTKGQLSYDLVLILDISSSMNTTVNGLSRLSLEKNAAQDIINTYDDLAGNLKVTIIPFGSDSTGKNTITNYSGAFSYTATSVSDALNYLNGVSVGMNNPNGGKLGTGTHYNDALHVARTYLNTAIDPNSSIKDYEHVVYFMTDGVPTNNRTALNLSFSWQDYINDPDNLAFGGVSGSPVSIIDVIPVTIDVTNNAKINNALIPVGNTGQSSEIVNLDYYDSNISDVKIGNIINLSSLYHNLADQPPVTINLLTNDVNTFDDSSDVLTLTQISYFNATLNAPVTYNLPTDNTDLIFVTDKGATVTVNIDGTFTYQAGAGFNSPTEKTEIFDYKMANDCNITADGQITATTYNNNYTLVNLLGTPGDDSLNTNGVYNQGTVIMSGAAGNNTFTIDMGNSGLKAELIVIKDFAEGGHNTLKFINVDDTSDDNIIQNNEIIAQISSSSVQSDSPYAGANISFTLTNGTSVILENFGPMDPIAPPPTPTALISLIDDHGNIVATQS
jgi:hypothetical protein